MQRFILTIIIFLIIIAISLISLNFVIKKEKELQKDIDDIINSIKNNENTLGKCEDFYKKWAKTEHIIITLVQHESIDEITIRSKKMIAYAKTDNKSSLLAEIYSIQELLKHICEDEKPLFHNFF